MEISASNQTSAYQRSGSFIKNTVQKASRASTGAGGSPDYTVNISSQGRSRSQAEFSRTQRVEKNDFTRGQRTDENSNERDLDSRKRTFEQKQAAEERQFDTQQAMAKRNFIRGVSQSGS